MHGESVLGKGIANRSDRSETDIGVTDDAAFPDAFPSGLELWLDEQDPIAAVGTQSGDLFGNHRQGDEREIADHKIERSAEIGSVRRSDVGPFDDGHACIIANVPMHLSVADVDGDDMGCASLEDAVREAAG